MPRLLPRFHASQERIEDERKIAALVLASDEIETVRGMPLRRSADGHNRDRARGVLIVGPLSGRGASPGTDPVAALLRSDSDRYGRSAEIGSSR